MKKILENQKTENENGRSMIEMLGVLAIIGVLSVGGIAGYSKAMHRYRLNKTIEQITYMGGAIRSFFTPQKSYEELRASCTDTQRANGQCMAMKAKLVPDDMWESGKDYPQHVWDNSIWGDNNVLIGSVCVRRSDCAGGTRAFRIIYQPIPEEACIDLITYDWSNAGVNMIEVDPSRNPEQTLNYRSLYFSTPVSIETAIRVCSTAGDDMVSAVLFYFDVDVNTSNGSSDWKDYIDATTALLNGS